MIRYVQLGALGQAFTTLELDLKKRCGASIHRNAHIIYNAFPISYSGGMIKTRAKRYARAGVA